MLHMQGKAIAGDLELTWQYPLSDKTNKNCMWKSSSGTFHYGSQSSSTMKGLEPEWSNLDVLITHHTELVLQNWKCITGNYEDRTLNFWSCMGSQLST